MYFAQLQMRRSMRRTFRPDRTCLAPLMSVARLGFVVDANAPGETNRETRKVIKATLDLANKVQHDLVGDASAGRAHSGGHGREREPHPDSRLGRR